MRVVECERGTADVLVQVAPRFDYGAVRPWLRRAGASAWRYPDLAPDLANQPYFVMRQQRD